MFEACLDDAPIGIAFYDKKLQFIYVNSVLAQINGLSVSDTIGHTPSQILPDIGPRLEQLLQTVLRTGKTLKDVEITGTTPGSGTVRQWIANFYPLRIHDELIGVTVMVTDITNQKRAQQQSTEKTRELERVFRLSLDLLCIADTDGNFVKVNPAWEQTLGYKLEELEHRKFLDFVHPDDLEATQQAIADLASGKSIFDFINRYRHKNGSYRWIEWRSLPYEGKLIYAAARDITERKQYQQSIELDESRLEALLKLGEMGDRPLKEITDFAMEEGVRLTKSTIGYLAFTNEDETVLTMHSWSSIAMRECMIQDKPFVYPMKNVGLWGETVRQRKPIITNDYDAPNEFKKGYPKGHIHLKRHMNIPVFEGTRIVAVAGVANKQEPYNESDVRQLQLLMDGMWRLIQRKNSQITLMENEANLSSIFRAVPAGIGVVVNRVITKTNDRLCEMTGYTSKELIGKSSRMLYPTEKEFLYVGAKKYGQITQRGTGTVETRWIRKDGTIIDILLSSTPLDTGNLEKGVTFSATEITERKQNEKAREQLAKELKVKNDELESIIYVASHDLRSAMVNVKGFSRELADYCQTIHSSCPPEKLARDAAFALKEGIPQALDFIGTSVSKIDSILNGLLRLSRLGRQAPIIMPVDMNVFMTNIAQSMQLQIREAGAIFEIEHLPPCQADSSLLSEVFTNLIDNAIKYRDPSRPLRIRITGKTQDSAAVYCVADNGMGINSNYQQKIFEPFHRLEPAKTPGEGLGLSIIKRILDLHNGTISLDSTPGQGSKFYITLPA